MFAHTPFLVTELRGKVNGPTRVFASETGDARADVLCLDIDSTHRESPVRLFKIPIHSKT